LQEPPMKHRTRSAVTLFELLIVLAFLALLFAMMLPALAKVRVSAARAQSMNNLKQIGIAAHNYNAVYNVFPPGVDDNSLSGYAYLLPYLEQANLFQLIDFKKSVDDKANETPRKTQIRVFNSPLDSVKSVSMDYGPTSYLLSAGSDPALENNNGIF